MFFFFFLLPIIQAWLFPARKFLGRIAPTIHRLDKPIRGIVGAILAVTLYVSTTPNPGSPIASFFSSTSAFRKSATNRILPL